VCCRVGPGPGSFGLPTTRERQPVATRNPARLGGQLPARRGQAADLRRGASDQRATRGRGRAALVEELTSPQLAFVLRRRVPLRRGAHRVRRHRRPNGAPPRARGNGTTCRTPRPSGHRIPERPCSPPAAPRLDNAREWFTPSSPRNPGNQLGRGNRPAVASCTSRPLPAEHTRT